jgi:hypothetical protein
MMNLEHGTKTQKQNRPKSSTLQELNRDSKVSTFSLSDVNWELPIDKTVNWAPEGLSSVNFLPSYKLLSESQTRKYNQLHALSICEQFIWFESDLIAPLLEGILARNTNLSIEMKEALYNFVEEEYKHSEMFRLLMRKAAPELYQNCDYHFFKLSEPLNRLFQFMVNHPEVNLTWVWLAVFFEERTADFSRRYISDFARFGPSAIDQTFHQVHKLHMIDEARHIQIDQHLLDEFFVNAPLIRRKFAGWMTSKVFKAYTRPRNTAVRIIKQMIDQKVLDKKLGHQLITELPNAGDNIEFLRTNFGKKAAPRTRKLLALFPEMAPVFKYIKTDEELMK